MDLNSVFLWMFGILGIYVVYTALTIPKSAKRPNGLPPPQQFGKTRQIQSKTGDASMKTELIRRQAIYASGQDPYHTTKETTTRKGTGTGALETFLITSLCPCPPKPVQPDDILYYGGDAGTTFCPILDGSEFGKCLDGSSNILPCRLEPQPIDNTLCYGGDATNDFCPILNGDEQGVCLNGNANILPCDR
jgi:hypothetical protein